jgi:hypothetical protein
MVKVNNGWQSHNIDQVESLASHAVSPTSSNSTLPGRHGNSASPRLASLRGSNNTTPASAVHSHFEGSWPAGSHSGPASTLASPMALSLAPPISLQPAAPLLRGNHHPRRNSNPAYSPAQLLPRSHHGSPQTPQQTHHHARSLAAVGTPNVDPILFSPHQNVREQDAIETLLFMSSPGNSANLKHAFPSSSSSQPLPQLRTSNGGTHSVASTPGRTALPGSQPRKQLPTGRPSSSQPARRVGFDADDGGGGRRGGANGHALPVKVAIPMSSGLSGSRPRVALKEEDIEKMLDAMEAAESSDDDEEIVVPVRRDAGSVGI